MALPHANAGEIVRLGQPGQSGNNSARTRALVKLDRFEAVELVLARGSAIPAHAVDGPITLYCIAGAVLIDADKTVSMMAGDWLYLEGGQSHALRALEDSSLLLTIIFP